jgi:hypothetical protein
VVYRDASGQVVHAAIRPLKNKPWTVVAFESEDRLLAPALWALADQAKIVALAALFSAALTFAYLRRSGAAERRT